jgi:hypothetical protein
VLFARGSLKHSMLLQGLLWLIFTTNMNENYTTWQDLECSQTLNIFVYPVIVDACHQHIQELYNLAGFEESSGTRYVCKSQCG